MKIFVFVDAKTKGEYVRLAKESLQLKRMNEELVSVAEINHWIRGMIDRAHEVLLPIGSKLQDRLAQEANPHECEKLIDAEVPGVERVVPV